MSVALPDSDLSRQTKPGASSASALMGLELGNELSDFRIIQRGHKTSDVDLGKTIGHGRLRQRNL